MMLNFHRIPGVSPSDKFSGLCSRVDRAVNFERGLLMRYSRLTCCCVFSSSLRDSSSDDNLKEYMCERRKGGVVPKKSGPNALISSARSLGFGAEVSINESISSKADYDKSKQLTAKDGGGRLQSLMSHQEPPKGVTGGAFRSTLAHNREAKTSPTQLRQEPNLKKYESRNGRTDLLQEFPDHIGIKHGRGYSLSENDGTGSFVMEDGETYTNFSVGINGLPIVCNSKGCRPLSESERRTPMYTAHVLGWPNYREFDAHKLREMEEKSTHFQDDFQRAIQRRKRAIVNGSAKLSWELHADMEAADDYFNRALEAAPDNCHVLASYASFLWDEQ